MQLKWVWLVGIGIVGGLGWLLLNDRSKFEVKKARLGNKELKLMIRDTAEGRRQGLSGFEKLEENEGMIFIFDEAIKQSFWMMGMKFDLDMIFLRNGVVVEMVEKVPAPKGIEAPAVIVSREEADWVIEVKAGKINEWRVNLGDRLLWL